MRAVHRTDNTAQSAHNVSGNPFYNTKNTYLEHFSTVCFRKTFPVLHVRGLSLSSAQKEYTATACPA